MQLDKVLRFSAGSTENIINEDANANNIIFTIKDKIICSCCNFIGKRQSKIIKTPYKRIWKTNLLECV